MDNETFEQIPLNESELGDAFKFVKENEVCKVLSYKGKVFGVEAPNFVVLEVTKTDPGFKGNTATNTLKPATLETGAEIRVPLFINEGDMIRIDTRTGAKTGKAARYGLACLILKNGLRAGTRRMPPEDAFHCIAMKE